MQAESVEVDFSKIEQHPKGALRFIQIFMRIEFALKENSFCLQRGNRLDVDWDRFVNERLGQDFFETIRDSGTARTLITQPPSRQVLRHNELDWVDAAPIQNCQDLFVAIRRVRNNLFHGGKSGDVDHDRNDKLIAEAEHVLIEALKSDINMRVMFEGKY